MTISNITAFLMVPSLALSTAVIADDPQEEARVFYNNCLVEGHNQSMKAGVSIGQFEKTAVTICTAERKQYFDAIYASEKEFGSSSAEAKAYAKEECDNVLQSFVSVYADNFESKALVEKS